MGSRSRSVGWPAVALALLMLTGPVAASGQHAAADAAHGSAIEALVATLTQMHGVPASHLEVLPGTRSEADGSTTVLAGIEDLAGPMVREAVDPQATAEALAPGNGGSIPPMPAELGVFHRQWQADGRELVTVGGYFVDPASGETVNVNAVVLEGPSDVRDAITDAAVRDALPIVANTMPLLLEYVHPTSLLFLIALVVAVLAVAVVAGALVALGFGDLATSVVSAYLFIALSPLFMNALYPYHVDPVEGELYRDFDDQFVWHTIKDTEVGRLWEGLYISRAGDYVETDEVVEGERVLKAIAFKRTVVGPVTRLAADTVKHAGLYERQDIHRVCRETAFLCPEWDAEERLTTGLFHEATGETPGVTVQLHNEKRGPQTVLYPEHTQTTIALGVTAADTFVPLVGTRTTQTHRPYVDVTNQGDNIGAIETYRQTNFGVFIAGDYTPVFGVDVWAERNPPDLWVLLFGLGAGLGDQEVGDLMVREGVYVDGRFVAVTGSRVDDDFVGHRYTYRTMLSTGVFVTNPLDPGDPVPGESPDGATYVPLHAVTYDGVQGSTPWANANALENNPGGMGTFLVSTGFGGPDAYFPVLGLEYLPDGHYDDRAARETYRVGVFPADYSTFVPLAGTTYDGASTSGSWTAALAHQFALGGTPPRADLTAGVYTGESYVPVVSVRHAPVGTSAHPFGASFELGLFELGSASPTPLVTARVGTGGPAASMGVTDVCDVSTEVHLHPTGHTVPAHGPCVR